MSACLSVVDTRRLPRLGRRASRAVTWAVALLGSVTALPATFAGVAVPASPVAILQELRHFGEMGSVLYVAAHPDDENTLLITYLARGRGYRTAYLSITRGDGGQNVLGPEFGDELGVIRTQELLAARRLDGGRQFFTRAIDFGFSKSAAETLKIWDRQQVLADVVRVIREFQPDVIVTRFSPYFGGTHGHHTASAILALEAFKLAGDSKAFPDQLRDLKPWQPKRIFWNGFFRGGQAGTTSSVVHLEISGEDPVLKESFLEIASRSRSMHKTQGFGNFGGFRGRGGPRTETFVLLAGDPATHDIMDGVDTTWKRFPGGDDIAEMANGALTSFDTNHPAASLRLLLKIRNRLASLPHTPLLDDKRRQLDRIVRDCLGLTVETTLPNAQVVPGETMHLRHTVQLRAEFPVRWVEVRYPVTGAKLIENLDLKPGQPFARVDAQVLPVDTPLTTPYWLRLDHSTGMFRVQDPTLIGRPENPPAFPIEEVFDIAGQMLVVPDQPVAADSGAGEPAFPRRLQVIAPVSLKFASDVSLFPPGFSRPMEVKVTAARANSSGTLHLDAPAGWRVEPASQPFQLTAAGDSARFSFTLTAPQQPAVGLIRAHAQLGGREFDTERIDIRYSHIPEQLLQPPARLKAVGLELATRGHNVGYIAGAGDSIAQSLQEMGYSVSQLTGSDLTPEKLRPLDAVVFGVRAFNVRSDLEPHMPALFAYVRNGGTVVVQYNRPNGLRTETLAPFPLHLSNERVTDETAPVKFLEPDHPALNVPNKITEADFDGWIQERGIYFPSEWDSHFQPLLACGDPGETPLKGSLLVAHDGQGYYVYTGLVFFRELPAGVPGAYRLFANLVSLGKSASQADAGGAK